MATHTGTVRRVRDDLGRGLTPDSEARGRVVGVISDTHGLLRPEATAALAGSHVIVHAGDIGTAAILDGLRAVAPVVAVRGNNDRDAWAASLPEVVVTDVAGVRVCVIHDLKAFDIDPERERIDVVISGHSHRPAVERRGRLLLLNPGSAGPRRFSLPVTVGRLRVTRAGVHAEIVELAVAAPSAATSAGSTGVRTSGRAGGRPSPRTSRAPRRAGTPPPTRGSDRSPRTYADRRADAS